MLTIILLILLLYVLPGFILWLYIHIAHSKGGVFEGITVSISHVVLLFIPLVNLCVGVFFWILEFPIKYENNKLTNKFFKIK